MTYSIEENHLRDWSCISCLVSLSIILVAACKMARMFSSLFLGGIIFISYKKEYPCKKAAYKLSDMCTSVDMWLTNLYSLKTYPKYSNDFYYISKRVVYSVFHIVALFEFLAKLRKILVYAKESRIICFPFRIKTLTLQLKKWKVWKSWRISRR